MYELEPFYSSIIPLHIQNVASHCLKLVINVTDTHVFQILKQIFFLLSFRTRR